MFSLQGYRIDSILYEAANSNVYKGIRESDGAAVAIKVLTEETPTTEQIAKFKYEYQLLASLNGQGTVVTYGFLPNRNGHAIIMSYFESQTLRQLLSNRNTSLIDKIKIAINLIDALGIIHKNNIIHKDINPDNILIGHKSFEVKIIDFGVSCTLSREEINTTSIDAIEGALKYISPEQTGQMNRGINYLSDYYSYGMVLYEIFTGKHAFETTDQVELIHCHLAMIPPPAHEVNSSLPAVLSEIIIKLINKIPEDRYQSVIGIKHDLQKCLDMLLTQGKIDHFPTSEKDRSTLFNISEKLYGRDTEKKTLIDTFHAASDGGFEILFISGYSGIGKSRLIHEIYKYLHRKKGYLVSGKFDQFEKHRAYSGFIMAIEDLVSKILTESEENVLEWKKQIISALGGNAQIMIELVPTLEALIGPQQAVEMLGTLENQQRYNLMFQNFINVIATEEHPFVLFLDDLQWIDFSSLSLLDKLACSKRNKYFMLIGSYRENEVSSDHPIMGLIDSIKQENIEIKQINLTPLSLTDVELYLSDTMRTSIKNVKELAEICYEKTRGNPFFLNQFLKNLHNDSRIQYDHSFGIWAWNTEDIKNANYTDNVMDLIANKLKLLPKEIKEALQIAAFLGNKFDLFTLAALCRKTPRKIFDTILPVIHDGTLIPSDASYRYLSFFPDDAENNIDFTFLHDRIQQAAYSLISEKTPESIHLNIGRILLKKMEKRQQFG